ncbi:hypothetical protein Tco_0235846 [Tanacetum coccineum]
MTNLTDMLSKFVNANTASSSGTGTLPSNTVTNPKEDLKGITTRSGVAYKGPTIPTTSLLNSGRRETDDTKGHDASLLITEAPKTSNLRLSIMNQSLIPINTSNALAYLGESINLKPYFRIEKSHSSLTNPDCMTLEQLTVSISKPIVIAEDVYCDGGKFNFQQFSGRRLLSHTASTFNSREEFLKDHRAIDRCIREYSQEVVGSQCDSRVRNPTPTMIQLFSTSSPTLTPIGTVIFSLFEEADFFSCYRWKIQLHRKLISTIMNPYGGHSSPRSNS